LIGEGCEQEFVTTILLMRFEFISDRRAFVCDADTIFPDLVFSFVNAGQRRHAVLETWCFALENLLER
jgi:hypothetical protein